MSHHTYFAKQIQQVPSLADLGLKFDAPQQRKDHGIVEYTTVTEAIHNWAKDPFGESTLHFLAQAYGISRERLPEVLAEAGMQDYVKAKAQGRFVTMVSSQILKPTYYYLSNAFALAQLAQQGIPTALIVGEYPQDKFHPANADKKGAFGKIDFPVSIKEKQQADGKIVRELETVQIELRPYGIRHDDGLITHIARIEDAIGYRCEQVLVQVISAHGPENQNYTQETTQQTCADDGQEIKETELATYYQAALGMQISGLVYLRTTINKQEMHRSAVKDVISITDFYRLLWIETIARLRQTGDLPSEEAMPMFLFNIPRLYTTIAKHAKPSQAFLEMLGLSSYKDILEQVLHIPAEEAVGILNHGKSSFDAYLAKRNLVQLENGLLAHSNGMLEPACYYPADMAWPDLHLVCLSCVEPYFIDRVKRAQATHKHFNVQKKQIRLPDQEVPQLEKYVIHPTGKYFQQSITPNPRVIALQKEILALKSLKLSHAEYRKQVQQLTNQMNELRNQAKDHYFSRIKAFHAADYTQSDLILPDAVAAVYQELLATVPETVQNTQVQATVDLLNKCREYRALHGYFS